MNRNRILTAALTGTLSGMILLPVLSGAPQDRLSDPLTWSHRTLIDHARWLFRSLTLTEVPAWERRDLGWRDQCDVHLTEGSCDFPTLVTVPESVMSGTKRQSLSAPTAEGKQQSAALHFYRSLSWPSEDVIGAERAGPSVSKTPKVLAGPLFPSVLQTIYYNAAAAAAINSNAMDQQSTLKKRLSQMKGGAVTLSDLKVTEFDPDAAIIKTFWEFLEPGQSDFPGKNYAGGAWLFGRSTPPDPASGVVTAFKDSPSHQKIYVDIDVPDTCSRDSKTTNDHITFDIYSLGCFYYRSVHPSEVQQISQHASSNSDIPHVIKCDGPNTAYCYLILVGIHVMTRETPNWLWMTFWWNTGWWDKHSGQTVVQDKWDLFDANATANNTDPVANPYLEGPNTGMYSNCMECHRHAVVRPGYGTVVGVQGNMKHFYFSGIAGTDWGSPIFPLASPSADPFQPLPVATIPARARDLQSPTCFFAGALQTHFLWTIAMHSASGPPTDPCPAPKNTSAPPLPRPATR